MSVLDTSETKLNKLIKDFAIFKKRIIILVTIVALGCAVGIWLGVQTGKQQHKSDVAQTNAACWNSFNGRSVLRAVAAGGLQAPFSKEEQKLIDSSPVFQALIKAAKDNQKNVDQYFFTLIPLPTNCKGKNPNPVDPKVLVAAGVDPKSVRQ